MRRYFLALAMLGLSINVWAQPELGECDQEVEELAKTQLPKALRHWKAKNYREAERYLVKAVNFDPEYADALYLLGDLYVKKLKLKQAEAMWLKLLEVCPDYKAEVKYFVGSILLENGQYERSIEQLESFLADPSRDKMYDTEVKRALKEARITMELKGNPIDFHPVPVKRLSATDDEYLASISPDQQTMYFTRRSKKVNRRDGPAATVRMVEEFSMAKRQEAGDFELGAAMPDPFNQNYNEGGPSITADNTELYFTVCQDIDGYKNCDIYYSEIDEYGYWITPRSVGDHINLRDAWESQASVSANSDALYFTSNRPGGYGGLDLYKCTRLEDGTWSIPVNLGPTINTKKNEKTPFIHSDSHTLYFSSDGQLGLGGFDIYYARSENDTTWNEPKNIGYPINTEEDDLGLFVSLDGQTGYFASNKFRAATGWDIYKFDLPERAQPEAVTLIVGELLDDNDEPTDQADIQIKNLKSNEVTKINVDKETGKYARVVQKRPQEDLILTVKKEGAAFSSKYISSESKDLVVKAPLKVEELKIGKEYKLNDIKFSSKSYQLDHVAKSVIDEFILYLKENPHLKADIQGHTDNVGNDADNLLLSKQRSETVYNYVLDHGISKSRLSYHGYGESRPRSTNETEEGRAENRRTVFVITAK